MTPLSRALSSFIVSKVVISKVIMSIVVVRVTRNMLKIGQFFEKWPKTVTKLNNAKIQTMFKKSLFRLPFGNTIYYIFIYFFSEPTKVA